MKKWQGLSRYYTASEKPDPFDGHEYAKLSTILDTPVLELTYYADVAGESLHDHVRTSTSLKNPFEGVVPEHPIVEDKDGDSIDVGNGGGSPQWGIELIIGGGQLNYGPWTDRQR